VNANRGRSIRTRQKENAEDHRHPKSPVNAPIVSVVIPCFNHGEFLPEAVASIAAIERNDVELVVVDDGSTDKRTRQEINALTGQGIKVVLQENKGVAAARNAGVVVASGEYILPLDADNRLRPGYIEHGIRILDANPQVGVVYGDAEYIGARSGRWYIGPFDRDRLLQCNQIDACAMYRRSVWEQNNGYDGTMPVQGFEDWDFWLSALEKGWLFAYVAEILFDYRVAKESMLTRGQREARQVEKFIALKHALLYRDAYCHLANQQKSLRWTFRNFGGLLKSRLRPKR
jgi:glycosyltransferase involved in cell wall biosynthesis